MATSHGISPSHSPQSTHQRQITPETSLPESRSSTQLRSQSPPLHGCQIRADMSFAESAATFDDWLSSPLSPEQARYRSRGTMRDCRTKIKALNKFFGPLILGRHSPRADSGVSESALFQRAQPLGAPCRRRQDQPGNGPSCSGSCARETHIQATSRRSFQTLQVGRVRDPEGAEPGGAGTISRGSRVTSRVGSCYWYSLLAVHIAFSSDEIRTLQQGRHQHSPSDHRREPEGWKEPVPAPRGSVDRASSASGRSISFLERSYRLAGKSPEMHLFPSKAWLEISSTAVIALGGAGIP